MRSLLFALVAPAVLAVATASADASSCLLGPFSIVSNPPLGCDVILVDIPSGFPAEPIVTAQRGSESIDITGTVTVSTMPIDVHFANYACDGSVIEQYTSMENATVRRITLQGAAVGDTIYVGGIYSGVVQAAGTCTEDFSQLDPYCTGRNSGYPCEDDGGQPPSDPDDDTKLDDAVGCNASHGSTTLTGLALLAFVALRRRR